MAGNLKKKSAKPKAQRRPPQGRGGQVKQKPGAAIVGVMHYVTHQALGMKLSGRLKKFWRNTPPGRLLKAAMVILNILKNLVMGLLAKKKGGRR
nr:core protein C [Apoi virus]